MGDEEGNTTPMKTNRFKSFGGGAATASRFRPIPLASSPQRLLTPRDQNRQLRSAGYDIGCVTD